MASYDVCAIKVLGLSKKALAAQKARLANRVSREVAENFARKNIDPTADQLKDETARQVNKLLSAERSKKKVIDDKLADLEVEMGFVAKDVLKKGDMKVFWDFAISRIAYMTGKNEAAIRGYTSAEGMGYALESEHLADLSKINDALNQNFLGTAITKNKGRDAEFLQHYIDGTKPADEEMKGALEAFEGIIKRKDEQYADVFKQKRYRVSEGTNALPVVVNASILQKIGKDEFVRLMTGAGVKHRKDDELKAMYDNIIKEAESNDGFAVNGETEMEFTNAKGYVKLMNAMGVDTLTAQIQTNVNHYTRALGIADTVGDVATFISKTKKIAGDNGIPETPAVFGFSTGYSTLEGAGDSLLGRLDNSIASWDKINEKSFDTNTGIFTATKMGKTVEIKLTGKDLEDLVENGKLLTGDPAKRKRLEKIVAGKTGYFTAPGAQAGVMSAIMNARPVIGAFRLGGAVFGLLGESGVTGMAVSNISSYHAISASLQKLGGTFSLQRKDMQDMGIELGGRAMTLQQSLRPMMRGMVDGTEGQSAKVQKLMITGSMEASGFSALVSNAYHQSAKAFSMAITHNLKKYGKWNDIPIHYRQNLETYGIDEGAWNSLHKALIDKGDNIMKTDSFGGAENGIVNVKKAFAEDSTNRRKFMAAMAQFQIVTSGEATAVSRSIISRGGAAGRAAPRGTLQREIPESIFQFLTYSMNTWGGIINPFYKSFLSADDKTGQKIALMGMMLAAGYGIYQGKNLVRDGEFKETSGKNAMEHFFLSLGYSGLGGLYTSSFLDPYASELGLPVIAANPTSAAATDLVKLITGTADHIISTADPSYEKDFLGAIGPKFQNLLAGVAPNTWWLRYPTDNYGYDYFRNLGMHQHINNTNNG